MAVPASAQQPTPAQAVLLAAKYGPSSGLAFQRSQYLADALQRLQESAAENNRTPLALGANLLADGILQWSKSKADRQAMAAYANDTATREHQLFDGTPGDPGYKPPASPAIANAVDPSAVPPTLAAAPAPQPVTTASLPPAANPGDLDTLARMVYGEARGEPAAGQQAVAAVALNRARKNGQSLADVISAPHQFEGYNDAAKAVPSAKLADIIQNIQPALAGQDPTGGATNFLNPDLQAQLGRPQPAWAPAGQGMRIGHHVFYGGDPAAVQLAANAPQAQPPQPPPPLDPNGPPVQNVQPYQVAAAGPGFPPPPQSALGPPPQAGPQPAPMPSSPLVSPGAAGMAPAPAGPPPAVGAGAGPPTNFVPPALWAHAKALYDNPQTREEGAALAEQLRERSLTPPDPSKPYWGPDGQAHYAPGTTFTDQPSPSPNQFVQRGPDNQIHVTANNAFGAVPAGSAMNPAGGLNQLQVGAKDRFRIPGAPGFYTLDEKGNPQKVADDNYTVKDVGQTMQELTSSQQYDKAAKLTEMYRGAVAAATRPGGISDAELKDNAAQIFSGGVARQFNAKMLDEGQGPWLRLKQFFPDIASGQKLSPEARQAMVQAMHDYATEAQGAFTGLAQSKSAYAAQNGVNLAPFITPLMRELPPVPDISTIPTGIGGYQTGGQPAPVTAPAGPPQNPQAAAIQAEIARRKAAGIWKGN